MIQPRNLSFRGRNPTTVVVIQSHLNICCQQAMKTNRWNDVRRCRLQEVMGINMYKV